jgi:hypothetical protein
MVTFVESVPVSGGGERSALTSPSGSMGHQASKSRYNGAIDTVISALSMRTKAAKRATACHEAERPRQKPVSDEFCVPLLTGQQTRAYVS